MTDHPHSLAHNQTGGRYLVHGRWQNDLPENIADIKAIWIGQVLAADLVTEIHQGKIQLCVGTPYGSLGLIPNVRRVWKPIEEQAVAE